MHLGHGIDAPLIPGLLGTSRTVLGLPSVLHEPIGSSLGRIHQIWQELESITSPIYVFPKLLELFDKTDPGVTYHLG